MESDREGQTELFAEMTKNLECAEKTKPPFRYVFAQNGCQSEIMGLKSEFHKYLGFIFLSSKLPKSLGRRKNEDTNQTKTKNPKTDPSYKNTFSIFIECYKIYPNLNEIVLKN